MKQILIYLCQFVYLKLVFSKLQVVIFIDKSINIDRNLDRRGLYGDWNLYGNLHTFLDLYIDRFIYVYWPLFLYVSWHFNCFYNLTWGFIRLLNMNRLLNLYIFWNLYCFLDNTFWTRNVFWNLDLNLYWFLYDNLFYDLFRYETIQPFYLAILLL